MEVVRHMGVKLSTNLIVSALYILSSVWVLPTPTTGRNMLFECFFVEKTLNQHFGANLKNTFFLNFASNFLLFNLNMSIASYQVY